MKNHWVTSVAFAVVAAAGCASRSPHGAPLTGERSARVTGVETGSDADAGPAVLPVEHVFELTNAGSDDAVIVSHRTRIDTTWHFADTGDAVDLELRVED